MELLLLLTALFASLTGASAGDRGVARPAQGVEVVQAAEAVQAAVQQEQRALPVTHAVQRQSSLRTGVPSLQAAPVASLRLAFEQRRE